MLLDVKIVWGSLDKISPVRNNKKNPAIAVKTQEIGLHALLENQVQRVTQSYERTH